MYYNDNYASLMRKFHVLSFKPANSKNLKASTTLLKINDIIEIMQNFKIAKIQKLQDVD